jgi:hypothetical protein
MIARIADICYNSKYQWLETAGFFVSGAAHVRDTNMTDQNNPRFQGERYLTLRKILDVIEEQQSAIKPTLIIDISLVSPGAMQDSAQKESWALLASGIRHLMDGAPGGAPGSMTSALSKASLRSSSLASSVGVKPPQFQHMYYDVDYTTGHEAAIFDCKRLIEAAEGDLPKSRQIIQQKILTEKPVGAFGVMTDIPDPELRDLFGKVAQQLGVSAEVVGLERPKVPDDAVSKENLTAMRKQMVLSFNMLSDSYAEVCKKLYAALPDIPVPEAPAFKSKGRDFDL